MTDREMLEKILVKIESVEKKVDGIEKDVKYIRNEIDAYHPWVDRLDLRVRALEQATGVK